MAFSWNDVDTDVPPALDRLDEYNSGAFDISLNPHGMASGGHISQFPAALLDLTVVANAFPEFADLVAGYADAASASAVTAAGAVANFSGTSTSSVALSTGSKSFTTQSDKSWPAGTILLLTSDANPTTHWMAIVVTSYASTTLQGTVLLFSGSGSRADWTIRASGYPARAPGISYLWSTSTANSDPTSGFLKMNAVPGSASALYISETDFDGNSLGSLLATWDDSTSSIKGRILIQSVTQPANFAIADVTSTVTDNGTWDTFAITPVASGGTLVNGAIVSITYLPQGNVGSTGPTGASYGGTSTTSLLIGAGSKAFTTQAGLAYQVGARVRATDSANTSNWMEGLVTAYSSTTLTILSDLTNGSGTIASWNLNLSGERGATGTTGASGDDAGLEFQFNTATSGDPGTGKFRFNNATFSSATIAAISETDGNANAVGPLLAALDNGSGTNKILVLAYKQGGSSYFSFWVTSALSDQGTYDEFNITPITTSGSIALNDVFHLVLIPLEPGAQGIQGTAGPTTAPTWIFDSSTSDADPGSNEFRLNNGTIGSVNKAFVSDEGVGATDLTAFLSSLDDSTNSTHRGTLYLVQASDPSKFAIFTIGTATDDGDYFDIALTYVAGPGGFVAGEECAFAAYRTGNAGAGSGDVVGPAGATDTALAAYDGGTGLLLKDTTVAWSTGVLAPVSSDGVALGSTTKMWSDLFLASGAVINYANGNWIATHSSGVLTVGTGDLRVSTAGSNAASVVTVGGTQTLTNKTLTSPAITTPTGIVKGDVGLGNVDNTSDANKPISTAEALALGLRSVIRVRAATTGNVTIATALNNGDSLDGLTLATGELVLVGAQTSPAENGIFVVGVSPARHTDYDAFADYPGLLVIVEEGTANADTMWLSTANAGGTIDSTALTFVRQGGPSGSAGRDVLASAAASDVRTAAGLGTSATVNTGTSGGTIPLLNGANSWSASQTFINSSGIKMLDTNASHTLGLIVGSDLTGNHTLTLTLGDADRTWAVAGNLSTQGAFTISGAFGTTLTVTGTTSITLPTSGTLATTDASSLTSGTLPDARLSAAATPYGTQDIWIPASAMTPNTTAGPAAGTVEVGTSLVMFSSLDFDAGTQESAQFNWRMPPQWNEGTVTAIFVWKHAATTVNFGVVWDLAGVALSDDDAASTAFGTAVSVTDTGGTTNDVYHSSATSAITIAGTPAAGDLCYFRVRRVAANGSDTLAIDAGLLGVVLRITTDAGHD